MRQISSSNGCSLSGSRTGSCVYRRRRLLSMLEIMEVTPVCSASPPLPCSHLIHRQRLSPREPQSGLTGKIIEQQTWNLSSTLIARTFTPDTSNRRLLEFLKALWFSPTPVMDAWRSASSSHGLSGGFCIRLSMKQSTVKPAWWLKPTMIIVRVRPKREIPL